MNNSNSFRAPTSIDVAKLENFAPIQGTAIAEGSVKQLLPRSCGDGKHSPKFSGKQRSRRRRHVDRQHRAHHHAACQSRQFEAIAIEATRKQVYRFQRLRR